VPAWYKKHGHPTEAEAAGWQCQYDRARRGETYEVPEWTMRRPSSELHQLMSKEFWGEIPKDFTTILDVGCSDGYMVRFLKEHGKEAVGINDVIYPTDRLFIEEHGLRVYEMDMHCMDFDNGLFDAVWCRHSLEHSFSPLQVIAEIYRVLKPGGYLFGALPPAGAYPGHWHQIPDYQFEYLLKMSNFEVIRLWTAYYSYRRENDNLETRAICRKAR
jgi:SAM-dependent methyltransferase